MKLINPRGRRHWRMRFAAVAAVTGLALAGCAGASNDEPQNGSGAGGNGAGDSGPVIGGSLTAAVQQESASMDPMYGDAPGSDRNLYSLFYESLVDINPGGEIVPILASDYEISDDGLTYTFNLREGVKFHDGTSFDADTVVMNLERVVAATDSPHAVTLTLMEDIVAVDEYTVELTLAEPSGAFMSGLAGEGGMMVSPTAITEAPEDLRRHPIGTGPFVFTGFVNGVDVTGERFEDYWGEDEAGNALPYLDEITIRVISDLNVKLTELQTGGAQLIDSVPIRQIDDLVETGDFRVIDGRGQTKYMAFNTTRPPFDDKRVRQAVSLALDNEAISTAIVGDKGTVLATLCTETEVCFDDSLEPTPYDQNRAKELLAEAGYTDLDVTISIINREPDATIAQIVQAQLQEIGVNLTVESLERQAWISSVLDHDFDMATLQIAVPRLDPSIAFNGTFAEDAPQNWAGVNDAEMFAAVAEAETATDPEERRAAFSRAQQIIVEEEYYVFFYWNSDPLGASQNIHGLTTNQAGAWNLRGVYLTD